MNLHDVKIGMSVKLNDFCAKESGVETLSEVNNMFYSEECNEFLRTVNKWIVKKKLSGGVFDSGEPWSFFEVEPILDGTDLKYEDFLFNGDESEPTEFIIFDNVDFDPID